MLTQGKVVQQFMCFLSPMCTSKSIEKMQLDVEENTPASKIAENWCAVSE